MWPEREVVPRISAGPRGNRETRQLWGAYNRGGGGKIAQIDPKKKNLAVWGSRLFSKTERPGRGSHARIQKNGIWYKPIVGKLGKPLPHQHFHDRL